MTMGQARVSFAFATFMVAMFPHPVAINGDTATFPETQLGALLYGFRIGPTAKR